jgi:hypothetical protein
MREAPQHFERKFLANVNNIGVYKGIQLMHAESYLNVEQKNLLDEGIKYLIKRFVGNVSEIAKAVSVFDTFTWPEDLEGFGKEEIKILGKHFSKYFDNNEETVSINLMKEWYEFKGVGKH